MRYRLMTLAVLASSLGAATTAGAQSIDGNGRCRDATGQLTKMDLCRKAMPLNVPHHLYIRDNRGGCHDEKGNPVDPGLCKR